MHISHYVYSFMLSYFPRCVQPGKASTACPQDAGELHAIIPRMVHRVGVVGDPKQARYSADEGKTCWFKNLTAMIIKLIACALVGK